MFVHNIFLGNSYKLGKRVVFDVVYPSTTNENIEKQQKKLRHFSQKMYNKLGLNAAVTVHSLTTDSKDWQSVVKKDSFFDDTYLVSNFDEFINILNFNKILTDFDIKLLIYLLMSKSIIDLINREEIYNKILISYREKFKKNLYDVTTEEKVVPKDNELEAIASVIIDKVLSAEDGFEKLKFIIEELHKIIKMPLVF